MIRRHRAVARISAALTLVGVAALPFVSGCTSQGNDALAEPDGEMLQGSLHVQLAASLLPVAEVLAAEFEQLHPGVEVHVSSAGSSALREQVLAGAPADVFVPADPAHLEAIREDIGLRDAPVVVARNSLVLAVPAANSAGVASLADLSRPELLIGLCAVEVPCGALARAGLTRAGIEPVPDTDEPNVRALVAKLAAGELDAAVVYASDATTVADIESLGWTAGAAPDTTYEAAALAGAPNPKAAAAFVEFLLSAPARDAFRDYGFRAP